MDSLRITEMTSRKGNRIKLTSLMLKRARQLVKYRLSASPPGRETILDGVLKEVEPGRVELEDE